MSSHHYARRTAKSIGFTKSTRANDPNRETPYILRNFVGTTGAPCAVSAATPAAGPPKPIHGRPEALRRNVVEYARCRVRLRTRSTTSELGRRRSSAVGIRTDAELRPPSGDRPTTKQWRDSGSQSATAMTFQTITASMRSVHRSPRQERRLHAASTRSSLTSFARTADASRPGPRCGPDPVTQERQPNSSNFHEAISRPTRGAR